MYYEVKVITISCQAKKRILSCPSFVKYMGTANANLIGIVMYCLYESTDLYRINLHQNTACFRRKHEVQILSDGDRDNHQ